MLALATLEAPADDLPAAPPAADPDALLAELRSHPPAARAGLIARDPRFARRGLVDLLIARCRERLFDRPAEAVELTRLAVAAAERLDPGEVGAARAHDAAARAWAHHANALRVDGDPAGAAAAFGRAAAHRRRGSGDRLLAARAAELEASLEKDQQRFERAHALLASAIAVYRRRGAEERLGRALVKEGGILLFEGRWAAALRATLEALPLLRPERDPRTFAVAAHNAINCLNRAGYSIAARALLDAVRRLHERLGDELSLLRLDWMAAEIDRELGLLPRAERGLVAVRERFVERGMPYDAALVSLELAEIYARGQDPLRLERLAREMFPIFQSRALHRGALAALILFREAVAMRQADLRLIADLAAFLRSARRDRELRFIPRSRR
jgi:tetratricopeptide (TPR) repeat protein